MRKPVPFGKYLLLDRIAVGGMAEVFAAKTFGVEGFERLVAIKRILPTMVEDEEFITMFKDEANIASLLQHANLVQIFDLGKHDDTFYIAMEYISGRDVRLIVDKFRKAKKVMPVPMACFIMARVAEGLDYAHRKTDAHGEPLNIIHRDISPQNVLVSYEGDVKVIDFGIAKAAGRLQQTQAGILKGKYGYMSPEQVRGKVIDHRSDIFSAGVMFFEMLTGTKLFTGESDFSTLEKVRAGEVPQPSAINPLIPPDLERIVLKALAKERDERYQWAGELHNDLTRFLYSRDEIFSSAVLGSFMKEAFEVEVRKEQERVRRWWATQPEETTDFDVATPLPADPPRPPPPQASAQPPAPAQPPAFDADRTGLFVPFPSASEPSAPEPSVSDQRTIIHSAAQSHGSAPTLAPSLTTDTASRRAPTRRRTTSEHAVAPVSAEVRARADEETRRQAELQRGLPPPAAPLSVAKRSYTGLIFGLFAFLLVAAAGAFVVWKRMQAPTEGAYVVNIDPVESELRVLIDGRVPDEKDLPQGRLPVGEHSLVVEAEGYEPFLTTLHIGVKPEILNVRLQLRPPPEPEEADTPDDTRAQKQRSAETQTRPAAADPTPRQPAKLDPGSIVVNPWPKSARITVNGEDYGAPGSLTVEDLPGGETALIVVELEGYKSATRHHTVRPGGRDTVRVSLDKLPDEP